MSGNPGAARPGTATWRGLAAFVAALAVLATSCTTTSARQPPLAAHAPDGDGVLVVDAERFHLQGDPPWRVARQPGGFLGAGAVEAPDPDPPDGNGTDGLVYEVQVPEPGRYYVWLRGRAPDIQRNTVFVGVNGVWEDRVAVELPSALVWEYSETTVDRQRAAVTFPEAGEHQLVVWSRQEGVLVDRIVLAPDASFVPPLVDYAVLWSADHEGGDLSEWTGQRGGMSCGGDYSDASATATVTRELARSGHRAAALRIEGVEGDQGARLFRGRCEARIADGLYYSAWLHFPEAYRTVDRWWNVWQWKSQPPGEEDSDVQWVLDVNGDGEAMHFRMRRKLGAQSDWYHQEDPTPIPVGEWVHVEAYYRSAEDDTGRVVVWQDGVEIFRFHDVRTIEPGGDTRWSVNNYTSGIAPDPAVVYLDAAVISRQRVGPDLAPFTPGIDR